MRRTKRPKNSRVSLAQPSRCKLCGLSVQPIYNRITFGAKRQNLCDECHAQVLRTRIAAPQRKSKLDSLCDSLNEREATALLETLRARLSSSMSQVNNSNG